MFNNIDSGTLGIILTIVFGVVGILVYSSYKSNKIKNNKNFNLKNSHLNDFQNINMGNQERSDSSGKNR